MVVAFTSTLPLLQLYGWSYTYSYPTPGNTPFFSCSLPHQWISPSTLGQPFLLLSALKTNSFILLGRWVWFQQLLLFSFPVFLWSPEVGGGKPDTGRLPYICKFQCVHALLLAHSALSNSLKGLTECPYWFIWLLMTSAWCKQMVTSSLSLTDVHLFPY